VPEGPTIHRIARDHRKWIGGQKLAVCSPQGRFADEATLIDGRTLMSIDAWGKHLFYQFSGKRVLHAHLGLYGKFRRSDNPPPEPRGAVRVRMTGQRFTIDLNGPNQCEVIGEAEVAKIIARLGPDPLRDDAEPEKAWQRIARSKAPIGQLIMDQAVIAGIGNIYRTELLWLLRVHPVRPGRDFTRPQFKRLWKLSRELFEIAVEHERIITVPIRSMKKPATKLRPRERFNIFNQPKCPRCGDRVKKFAIASRRVFVCETCQPPPVP
jgi:endonuclease VIII